MQNKKSWGILILIGAIAVVVLVYLLSRAKKEKKQYYIPDDNGVIPDNGEIPHIITQNDFYCKRGDPCSLSNITMQWELGRERTIYTISGKARLSTHGLGVLTRQMSIKMDGIEIWQSSGEWGAGEMSFNLPVGRDVKVITFSGYRTRWWDIASCYIEELEAHIL